MFLKGERMQEFDDNEPEIVIPLKNFSYSNTTIVEAKTKKFLGRIKELNRLKDYLTRGHENKSFMGSILVAGFRGAGKTGFVNKVIEEYRNFLKKIREDRRLIVVRINLGSEKNIDSKTVLFNMVSLLKNQIEDNSKCPPLIIPFTNGIIHSLFLVFFLVFFYLYFTQNEKHINCPIDCSDYVYLHISISLFAAFIIICICKFAYSESLKTLHALQKLQIDMYATTENNFKFGGRIFSAGNKTTSKPLDNNQIESRLREIIKKAADYFEIIYIFDELDKLSGIIPDQKIDQPSSISVVKESQLRKQQVDAILGDIKNLISSSHAVYIFIAGRDMYDAYLSERGSSNSLYESLFNDHIYISSFLTDRSNEDIYYLDSIIEAFVVSNLISAEEIEEKLTEARETDPSKVVDFSFLKLKNYSQNFGSIETDNTIKNIKSILNRNIHSAKIEKSEIDKEELYLEFINAPNIKNPYSNPAAWKGDLDRNELFEIFIHLLVSKEKYQDIHKTDTVIKKKLINNIFILKTFVHFLTLHSWGNCKRLITLFESFVIYNTVKKRHELSFRTKDIQRLILASHLYISFHHNLSRMLMNADDKLVVSGFSVFHYILKYHSIGFSRGHILRMYETINIHSSPELTQIVDIILHNVLRNHIRKIRNSFYRYRFSFLYEQEIHFITTISDGESAVFSFSLNAMDAVKQHYRNLIADSQYARTDAQYENVTLASIHVVVGNFHFWEQSYDEARIQFGIALKILEKESNCKNALDKIDVVLQQVEVLLKLGSVAERMGNFSSAASIYISAEEIANDCLKILYGNGIKNQDSKWDVLRQPMWARQFLNLKRSAIHYGQHDHLDNNISDVSRYRNAVLSFFMEDFPGAYSGYMSVIKQQKEFKDNERAFFLEGNAYLKASFSLLLNCSDNLYKCFKKISIENDQKDQSLVKILPILIESISDAVKEVSEKNKNLEDFEQNANDNVVIGNADNTIMFGRAIGLLKRSASSFERGKLNVNAATAYLGIVMMWEALLEMLPWQRLQNNGNNSFIQRIELSSDILKKIADTKSNLFNLRHKSNSSDNWIFSAQGRAFQASRNDTGGAFSHSMKVALSKNVDESLSDTLFAKHDTVRDMIFDENFLKHYLYQHYSIFGQAIIASAYWEEATFCMACQGISENSLHDRYENLVRSVKKGNLLPYGIRHYSIMLWLKGRIYLNELREHSMIDGRISEEMLKLSTSALINLYRSSQYVIKSHGETANMALPPLYIIYYNMWEVIFYLVSSYKIANPSHDYSETVSIVREELDKRVAQLRSKDISSRILDLRDISQMTLSQLKIVEQMGDLNSRDRTSIIRKKYYLDDDYEDNIFNLDWCYSRFLAPAAIVHRLIIESEMRWIKKASV